MPYAGFLRFPLDAPIVPPSGGGGGGTTPTPTPTPTPTATSRPIIIYDAVTTDLLVNHFEHTLVFINTSETFHLVTTPLTSSNTPRFTIEIQNLTTRPLHITHDATWISIQSKGSLMYVAPGGLATLRMWNTAVNQTGSYYYFTLVGDLVSSTGTSIGDDVIVSTDVTTALAPAMFNKTVLLNGSNPTGFHIPLTALTPGMAHFKVTILNNTEQSILVNSDSPGFGITVESSNNLVHIRPRGQATLTYYLDGVVLGNQHYFFFLSGDLFGVL